MVRGYYVYEPSFSEINIIRIKYCVACLFRVFISYFRDYRDSHLFVHGNPV